MFLAGESSGVATKLIVIHERRDELAPLLADLGVRADAADRFLDALPERIAAYACGRDGADAGDFDASTAHVRLPETDRSATARPLQTWSVLMVEDDPLVASVVAPALEALGHRVRLCSHADAAREILAPADAEPFDVLLTDVVMPGAWSGLDLADWCRADRPWLAVVVATGYATRDAPAGTVVLRKPYTLEALIGALDKAVAQRQVSQSPASDRVAAR